MKRLVVELKRTSIRGVGSTESSEKMYNIRNWWRLASHLYEDYSNTQIPKNMMPYFLTSAFLAMVDEAIRLTKSKSKAAVGGSQSRPAKLERRLALWKARALRP